MMVRTSATGHWPLALLNAQILPAGIACRVPGNQDQVVKPEDDRMSFAGAQVLEGRWGIEYEATNNAVLNGGSAAKSGEFWEPLRPGSTDC